MAKRRTEPLKPITATELDTTSPGFLRDQALVIDQDEPQQTMDPNKTLMGVRLNLEDIDREREDIDRERDDIATKTQAISSTLPVKFDLDGQAYDSGVNASTDPSETTLEFTVTANMQQELNEAIKEIGELRSKLRQAITERNISLKKQKDTESENKNLKTAREDLIGKYEALKEEHEIFKIRVIDFASIQRDKLRVASEEGDILKAKLASAIEMIARLKQSQLPVVQEEESVVDAFNHAIQLAWDRLTGIVSRK